MMMESYPEETRRFMGESLIAFPDCYVVVDLETTGLSPTKNNIIEIGAVRYKDGREIDRFASLLMPPANEDGLFVSKYITCLTGITNEMLLEAPATPEVLKAFDAYLGNDIILGYNVGFDVNFLYDKFLFYLGKPLRNDFIDICRISKKLYPDMPHHRLKDMVAKFQIHQDRAHRAISDVEATQECHRIMAEEILCRYASFENFRRKVFGYR